MVTMAFKFETANERWGEYKKGADPQYPQQQPTDMNFDFELAAERAESEAEGARQDASVTKNENIKRMLLQIAQAQEQTAQTIRSSIESLNSANQLLRRLNGDI